MKNPTLDRLRGLLEAILQAESGREDLILELESFVNKLDERDGLPETFLMELDDLVLDLDSYEPDPVARAEDPVFYGDEKLTRVITSFLKRLSRS